MILAAVVALLGLAAVADAVIGDPEGPEVDRRRSARADRSRAGEAILGVGLLVTAAVIAGTDSWAWRAVAAMVSAVLVILGIILNRRYLAEFVTHRGAARRR